MPIQDIIFRVRVMMFNAVHQMKAFNNVMGQGMEQYRRNIVPMTKNVSLGARLAQRTRELTHGMRGFRMEMLGVMFFGMGMAKFFSGLLKPVLELVKANELWKNVLAVGLLPVGLLLLDMLLKFMDIFLNLSPTTQELIGYFVLLGLVWGKIIFLIGMFALGIGSLILMFGSIGVSIAVVLGAVVLISAIIVTLLWLWRNWETISVKVKVALAAVAIVIGGLLLFFGIWVGWILLIVAGIIGLIAIIKNWGKITTWLKNKWTDFWTWLKESKFGQFFKKWVIDPIHAAWDWLIEKIKAGWEKIKDIISKITEPFRKATVWIKEKVTGGRQLGGYIPQTGMYRLHAGETVQPVGANTINFAPNITVNAATGIDAVALAEEVGALLRNQMDNLSRR